MAFHYLNPYGNYTVRYGIGIQGVPVLYTSVGHPWLDPVTHFIAGSSWELGVDIVERLLGVYLNDLEPVSSIVGRTKPTNHPYDAPLDARLYGSFLGPLAGVARLIQGKDVNIFDPGREHLVYHPSWKGDVGPLPVPEDIFTCTPGYKLTKLWRHDVPYVALTSTGLELDNCYVPTADIGGWVLTEILSQQLLGTDVAHFIYTPGHIPGWGYRDDLLHTLPQIEEAANGPLGWFHTGVFPWGVMWKFRISEFSFSHSHGKSVVMRYKSRLDFVRNPGDNVFVAPTWEYEWDNSITLRFSKSLPVPSGPISWQPDGYSHTFIGSLGSFDYQRYYKLTYKSPDEPSGFGGIPVGSEFFINEDTRTDGYIFLSQATQSGGRTIVPDFPRLFMDPSLGNDSLLSLFISQVNKSVTDIRPSSFLSTSDAMEQVVSGVDTNLLEAIAEMNEVLDLLPDFVRLSRAIAGLRSGRLIETARDLFDFLTSLRLQQKFGWEPDYQLLVDTLPKMKSVATRIEQLANNGDVVGRGSFSYQFPYWALGREDSRLVTRSRVLISRDSYSVMSRVLGVKALGLLPSPSALWDLVPLSFVVDWFFNIGGRLLDAENAVYSALLGIKCFTHSYTISSVLTDEEIAHYNIGFSNVIGSERPSVQVYIRDVSQYAPPMGNGRFDFRLPSRPPDWMTAGSLFWKIFSSR